MKINALIERSDYLALVRTIQHPPRGGGGRLFPLAGWILVGMAVAALLNVFNYRLHLFSVLITIGVFFPAFFYFLVRAHKKMLPGKDGHILGYRSFQVDGNGIVEATHRVTTHVRWEAIAGFKETGGHFFVMLDRSLALIFPKRCFQDEEQMDTFRNMVRKKAERAEIPQSNE